MLSTLFEIKMRTVFTVDRETRTYYTQCTVKLRSNFQKIAQKKAQKKAQLKCTSPRIVIFQKKRNLSERNFSERNLTVH